MISEVRPYSIIVQFCGAFYEIILYLTQEEMEDWDREVDLETIHCIVDLSHQLKHLKTYARGATPL